LTIESQSKAVRRDGTPGHNPQSDTCQVAALIGPSRSGTTWVGTIIDSCPDVIYRFEPFHRMATVNREFRAWFDKLKNQQVSGADLQRIYELLVPAHALTNKAPFFSDKSYALRTIGRRQLWPIARFLPPIDSIYRALYSPEPGPQVVFKEVTFVKPLRNLLERTEVPIVYMVRHPCATVLSEVRRQMQGRAAIRQVNLRKLLIEYESPLAEQFPDVVHGTDIVERTALLWRCEIETCVGLLRRSTTGMIITYEQLAEDAHSRAPEILAHFGVRYSEQTRKFVDSLYDLRTGSPKSRRRTGWGAEYFSVYRNPRDEKEAWKRKISVDDRRKIERIVRGSPAIEYCAALGQWW
jgi:hypothetical protein